MPAVPRSRKTPIAQAGLKTRAVNALLAAEIFYMEDAQSLYDWELLRIADLGRLSFNAIRAWRKK